MTAAAVTFDPIARLTRDLRESARMLTRDEARYLVDIYYTAQDYRIRAGNQRRASSVDGEPHALVSWAFDSFETVENQIKGALGKYADAHVPGAWARSIHGIGPVIAAGLLAHIDMNPWHCTKSKANGGGSCRPDTPHEGGQCKHRPTRTAGAIWRFAGLDPTVTWGKGQKRPWNADLKRLCWIIGGSFVRLRASENDIYGKVYEERKAFEVAKNEAGEYAELARSTLESKKFRESDTRVAYEAGRLPDGRIDMRARRYATKLFLSHYHHVAHEDFFGTAPPKPYIIEHGGHTHFIAPPHWPM